MRRTPLSTATVAAAAVSALLWAAPAGADQPLIDFEVRFDPEITELDPFLSETCGFPVTFSAKGHFRGTVYFNADGSFKRFTGHPSLRQTLSSGTAAAKSPHEVDPASMTPALNPNFTWTCFETGGGPICQGTWEQAYENEPIDMVCDGDPVYVSGTGSENMTRWHLPDGRARGST